MNSVRTEPRISLLLYSTRLSSPALKIIHTLKTEKQKCVSVGGATGRDTNCQVFSYRPSIIYCVCVCVCVPFHFQKRTSHFPQNQATEPETEETAQYYHRKQFFYMDVLPVTGQNFGIYFGYLWFNKFKEIKMYYTLKCLNLIHTNKYDNWLFFLYQF